MATGTARDAGPVVVAVLAGALHLVIGYFYLISGLAVPFYALLPLWVWWFVLAYLLVRCALRGSWWTAIIPVVAAATWFVVVFGGGTLLGWTA
jgi:hypothetical protein